MHANLNLTYKVADHPCVRHNHCRKMILARVRDFLQHFMDLPRINPRRYPHLGA